MDSFHRARRKRRTEGAQQSLKSNSNSNSQISIGKTALDVLGFVANDPNLEGENDSAEYQNALSRSERNRLGTTNEEGTKVTETLPGSGVVQK